MEEKILEIKAYIESEKAEVLQKIDELVKDNRTDDARAYRAELNIYDIMVTLIETAEKKAAGDEVLFSHEFKTLADRIPSAWRAALEKAKEHNDYEKIMMEEAKLSVVDRVMDKFHSIF